ncbi:hypothetical protein B4083_4919 [Bacillus cereus]|nr:hypothetical protein B4083_4919 [Bacillus cereus]
MYVLPITKKAALYTLRCMDVIFYTLKIIGGEAYVSVQKILAQIIQTV